LAWGHETTERLPERHEIEIDERGAGLSGGQNQRSAIAQPKELSVDEVFLLKERG
jgi:ABC-type bacteriocin/lantibiotic exporter with double-glycine peptidase domain